jgi:lysophospholipase L1-like esterase
VKTALAAALALAVVGPAAAQTTYAPRDLPAAGASICPGGVCGAERLAPFFRGLAALEAGASRPVHVLQIGDSHTAGDLFTGPVRSRLQGRFGRGGRGLLAPGVPWAGYAPRQVQVTAQGWDWTPAPTSVGGYRSLTATGLAGGPARVAAGATLTFALDPEAATATVALCGREGRVAVAGDGAPLGAVELGAGACRTLTATRPMRTVTLRAAEGGAVLDAVWLEGPGPGLILSNIGHVGTTLSDLAARDEAVVAAELSARRPDLIVLAYGTNEGFDDGLDPVAYARLLRDQIDRLRRLAPGAAILILGAPDALRRGETGACPGAPERGPPPGLARVRDLQRRVAAEAGVAFWDWHGRMGGDCSAERLALGEDPLMRGDRVHFTAAGGEWLGAILAADLTGAYDAWRAVTSGGAD